MSAEEPGFTHRFVPGEDGAKVTLLVLHGTGADENDLIPLGQRLLPGAAILSPRGKVLEGGAPRFFRRMAEGVFDVEDLHARTRELAEFVERSSEHYGFDQKKIVAVGYSNGANIAGSLMLSFPGMLRAAVLLRAMVPFEPEPAPDLAGTPVFIASATADQMIPTDHAERLGGMLTEAGAEVDQRWRRAGHGLTAPEVEEAREWLASVVARMYDTEDTREG
ncbi:alpha/beta hydrolase [Rubrobacter aplysinae]|uniref:alpha/beta hydrolase n=1 Tax=Rubrobacter aplysinae TaxID=909625 RepID=UPI00064C2B1C|nr:alpha/beta hydrolase [Rubrobacter aplysinae]